MSNSSVTLHGRIFLCAEIKLVTGLHIGGAAGGLEIGGVDKPVIRNPLNRQPYIPGSSLKGKLRSLMEKVYGAPQNYLINNIHIHLASNDTEYQNYPISRVFGTLPENAGFPTKTPTRLTVRDVQLADDSIKYLNLMKTDLPFTETKWEAAIDRVTSAATPRQIERVPAGAVFGPAELIFSVYVGAGETPAEVAGLFGHVVEALRHLEDDYLGGMGSRGNGQVKLQKIKIEAKRLGKESDGARIPFKSELESLAKLVELEAELRTWLTDTFK
ncbi:MAG: type III-A CRISPR-associated RAMP protein Csm3 [Oscillochloris sp.]|nr:type III-A CRISPR-associated RAMP protein Csm3 [Oscillochloris sp.]